jgi:predicted transcriptional regulator
MEDFKSACRQAKQRLKNDFWKQCKDTVDKSAYVAKEKGLNEHKIKAGLYGKVKQNLKGEEVDEFYEKVKAILDSCGEVSDAIGRLTDREYFETLNYEEKQRYTLELSSRYLKAVEKYRKEKEITF